MGRTERNGNEVDWSNLEEDFSLFLDLGFGFSSPFFFSGSLIGLFRGGVYEEKKVNSDNFCSEKRSSMRWLLSQVGDVVMVCQAASQTRFRALKYENGIAGSATIVVRVIACFQPLQDCQAEYFRHLLKPVTNCKQTTISAAIQHSTLGDYSVKMREGCGSWFLQQEFEPDLNSLAAPHPLVQPSTDPQFKSTGSHMVSITGTLPEFANPEISPLQVGQVNESRRWCYRLPRFQQGLAPAPVLNSSLRLQFPANPYESHAEKITCMTGSGYAQKRFLVFDRSGDQTTLMFNSAIGTPIKCTSGSLKSPAAWSFCDEDPMTKVNPNLHSGPVSTNMFDENGTDAKSEMHEDTEELNALLYSDDDSYFTDNELTSAVHSPCTMTVRHEQLEGGTEKVASSSVLTRKRKLLDDSNDCVPLVMDTTSSVFGDTESSSGNKRMRLVDKIRETLPLLMDTASSVNPGRCCEYEDDADSSCINGPNPVYGDRDSSTGNKRMRMDKIRETVGVLRSIIPSGEGKDAIMVLDEAIDYLKSLKHKAKALGFNTL
ncbi:hypothetical protein V6N13_056930 [Hibiscus sabdariffa]